MRSPTGLTTLGTSSLAAAVGCALLVSAAAQAAPGAPPFGRPGSSRTQFPAEPDPPLVRRPPGATFGVAFVPRRPPAAEEVRTPLSATGRPLPPFTKDRDPVPDLRHQKASDLGVDEIYEINSDLEMERILIKLAQRGKQIDHLILAGHGSGDSPHLQWGDGPEGDMIKQDVDVAEQRKINTVAKKILANPKKYKPGLLAQARQEFKDSSLRLSLLPQVSRAMAPGARVLMINCSAARTGEGRKFVQTLGETLLGDRGGTIVASQSDIVLRSLDSGAFVSWLRDGEVLAGGVDMAADWVPLHIAGQGRRSGKSAFAAVPPAKPTQAMPVGAAPAAAPTANFTGTWSTRFGDLSLNQSGNRVTGNYAYFAGSLEGTVTGNVLRFKWKEPKQNKQGAGKFTMAADGQSFSGGWSYTEDPEVFGSGWNGTRK